jgi:hypothetical protein
LITNTKHRAFSRHFNSGWRQGSTARGAALLGPAPSTLRRGSGGWLCRRRPRGGEAWWPRTGIQRQRGTAFARRPRMTESKRRPKRPWPWPWEHCGEHEAQGARRRCGAVHGGRGCESGHDELRRRGEGRRTVHEQRETVSWSWCLPWKVQRRASVVVLSC